MVKNLLANAGDTGLIPGSGRSLEEKMATHSRIIAWEIPWTEEPGGLQSMGSKRIGHDLVTKPQHFLSAVFYNFQCADLVLFLFV